MNIFYSGQLGRTNQEPLNRHGVRRRLISFNDFLRDPRLFRKIDAVGVAEAVDMKAPPRGLELMFDSGAFAAWKRGLPIPFDEYLAFAIKHSTAFAWIVNLDIIPGRWGRRPSSAEIDRAAETGWANFYKMKEALGPVEGAKVIHVFHQGEHKRWLEKLLAEGGPFIGVSPGNDRGRDRDVWLDHIKPHLTDGDGRALRRCHAFGLTAPEILARHRWLYSADSTSWAQSAQYGNCELGIPAPDSMLEGIVPKARRIAFSRRTNAPNHFDRLSPADQTLVIRYLRALGLPETREGRRKLRHEVSLIYYLGMENYLRMPDPGSGQWLERFVQPPGPLDTSIARALSY